MLENRREKREVSQEVDLKNESFNSDAQGGSDSNDGGDDFKDQSFGSETAEYREAGQREAAEARNQERQDRWADSSDDNQKSTSDTKTTESG